MLSGWLTAIAGPMSGRGQAVPAHSTSEQDIAWRVPRRISATIGEHVAALVTAAPGLEQPRMRRGLRKRGHMTGARGARLVSPLRNRTAIAVFVGPALLAYILVVLIPVLWSLSYTVFEGNAIAGFHFVG